MSRSRKYGNYLQSEEWREKRESIFLRAYWRCEVGKCGQPAIEVHHLTYARLYREEPTDLVALCQRCHDMLTDEAFPVSVICIGPGGKTCTCPVCQYRRAEAWLKYRMRDGLARAINEALHTELLRVYGRDCQGETQYAGLAKRDLPPSLLCHRTGLAAGTSDACGACDSCLWVAAMEAGFRANEREEAEADGGEL